jgi:hypothetical protein
MFTPARDFLLETPWRIIIPNPNVNSRSPLILITKKSVNLSSCVLAKPNQLLSIIICLFKRWLFLIKPEDLFVLVWLWECKAKHAVNIMVINLTWTSQISRFWEILGLNCWNEIFGYGLMSFQWNPMPIKQRKFSA